jgi:hypothetical protein
MRAAWEHRFLSWRGQTGAGAEGPRLPMDVVNGYVCKTCCDVELARRNIDPADPRDDVHNPKSPNYGKTEDPHHPGKPLPAWDAQAVNLSGALAKVHGAANAQDPTGTPSSTYQPGAVVSVSA